MPDVSINGQQLSTNNIEIATTLLPIFLVLLHSFIDCESGPRLIDNVEKAILELNKKAIRLAVVAYFEDLSKKKPEKSREIMEALSEQILPRIESMEK